MESNLYSEVFNIQKKHFHSILKTERIYARKERLIKIKKWISKNQKKIEEALYKDFQKSPEEVAISEIKPVIGEINIALKKIRTWNKPKKVSSPLTLLGTKAKVIKEAKGVCLVIAPWNFPFMLAVGPIISALASGNTVVLKPSEMTPHTEELLKEMFTEVFNGNTVAVVTGGVSETQELLQLPWNHVFFTGSPQVGKIIMEKAAKHLTSVTLELGGRNPVIVSKNTNIRSTAKKLMWGKFFNNGQSCVSPNYLLVDHDIKNELIQELKFEFVEMYGNYPEEIKDNKSIARIVNNHHYKRVKKIIEDSIKDGAQVIFGNQSESKTNYISPTLLDNVTVNNSIFSEEIFGPVMSVLVFEDEDDVIARANGTHLGLAAGVFTSDIKRAHRVIHQLEAGICWINAYGNSPAEMPVGGYKQSGIGRENGIETLDHYTQTKSIYVGMADIESPF
mgnify:CR=1 FL=1